MTRRRLFCLQKKLNLCLQARNDLDQFLKIRDFVFMKILFSFILFTDIVSDMPPFLSMFSIIHLDIACCLISQVIYPEAIFRAV